MGGGEDLRECNRGWGHRIPIDEGSLQEKVGCHTYVAG